MSRRQNLYVGRAGQMAVMAEFLWRGWNVALPEVDVGDDVFVVKDDEGGLSRIQVKTATAQVRRGGFSAQFAIGLDHLGTPRTPDLGYVFAVRRGETWGPFTVISRPDLLAEHELNRVGSRAGDQVVFRFLYSDRALTCSGRDFSRYREDWSRWPVIRH